MKERLSTLLVNGKGRYLFVLSSGDKITGTDVEMKGEVITLNVIDFHSSSGSLFSNNINNFSISVKDVIAAGEVK